MNNKPTYEELKQRVQELEQQYYDHKQTTKELVESEERFKALHDASFGGIAIHDKGQILDCNQGLSEMTGFTNEELVSMDGLDLIAPDSLKLVLKNINNQGFRTLTAWRLNHENAIRFNHCVPVDHRFWCLRRRQNLNPPSHPCNGQ